MGAITTTAKAVGTKALEAALEEPVKRLSKHFCDACQEKITSSKVKKELSNPDFLRDYIIKSYNEIGRAKTLLYRDESQLIENFCINTDLSYKNTQRNTKIIKTDKVQNILDRSHKIIITGLGGVGKTIMMKFMHINCIKQLDLFPVFITLRNVPVNDGKVSIFTSVKEALTQYGAKMSDELIEASLQKGCYLILFDGFDEIKSEFSGTIANEIMKFSRKYDNNYFVVSSRPSDEFISWDNFKVLHTKPLSLEQALALIDKLVYDDETKNNFKNELKTNFYVKRQEFASNPLLLTTMFLVYYYNGFIPEDFCDYYEEAFRVMFYKHDKTKFNNYKREIHSKLSESELQRLFERFCFKTFFRQKYSFKEHELLEYIKDSIQKTNVHAEPSAVLKDLSQNLCMLVKDGLEYQFVHRSFQEYFAAIYTKLLSDDEQKKLLPTFIKNNPNLAYQSEYFPILVKLDGKRFYKNVISDILDEIEEIYNSVGQDDYELYVKIINYFECATYISSDNTPIISPPFQKDIYLKCLYLIMLYPEYKSPKLGFNFFYKFDSQIAQIINEKEEFISEYDTFKITRLNTAELIKELCERTGKKDEIMELLQSDIDSIKSLFQNRLYQESSIDDLLDDM